MTPIKTPQYLTVTIGLYLSALLLTLLVTGCATSPPPAGTSSKTFVDSNDNIPTGTEGVTFKNNNIEVIASVVDLDAYKGADKSSFTKTIAQQADKTLLRKGYRVADRSLIESTLKEIGFQSSGLNDAENARRLGKALNVKYIVVFSLTQLDIIKNKPVDVSTGTTLIDGLIKLSQSSRGDKMTVGMSANIVDVESFEKLWSEDESREVVVTNDGQIKNAIGQAAGRLAAALPKRN